MEGEAKTFLSPRLPHQQPALKVGSRHGGADRRLLGPNGVSSRMRNARSAGFQQADDEGRLQVGSCISQS